MAGLGRGRMPVDQSRMIPCSDAKTLLHYSFLSLSFLLHTFYPEMSRFTQRADPKRPLPVLPLLLLLPTSQPILGVNSQTSLITPPITPEFRPTDLPQSPTEIMETGVERAVGSPALHGGSATAFQSHLLALLSNISQHPSPSFPFPAKDNALQPAEDSLILSPYGGAKSQAEEAIERAVIALGERVRSAERSPSPPKKDVKPEPKSTANLPTPEWTPPVNNTTSTNTCPACTRPISDSSTPTNQPLAFPSPSSHPLQVSLSTPSGQLSAMRPLSSSSIPHNIITTSNGASVLIGGPGAAGWNVRGSVGESGMSAEKELELLKAQVQDIARVCKVSVTNVTTLCNSPVPPGCSDRRPDAEDHCPRRGPDHDRAERHHQLYGGPAQDLCCRGRAGLP